MRDAFDTAKEKAQELFTLVLQGKAKEAETILYSLPTKQYDTMVRLCETGRKNVCRDLFDRLETLTHKAA